MLESLRLSFAEKRTTWIIGGVVVFLIIALIALVALNGQGKAKSTAVKNPVIELVWWKTDYDSEVYQDLIAQFKELPGNSGVRLEVVKKESNKEYYQDLISDLAKRVGPDIFSLRNDDLPAYKEYLSPIELFRGKFLTDYKQSFVNLALRDTMDKDKVYGVTSYLDNLQMYYNAGLLNQNKLPQPASTWAELSKQIPYLSKRPIGTDSFVQSAIALGTGGKSSKGESNIPLHPDILPLLIFQNGGQLYDYQEQKNIIGESANLSNTSVDSSSSTNIDENSPTFKAIRFYLDFADSTTNRYSWNNSNPEAEEMFIAGNLAYTLNYQSFAKKIKQNNSRLNFNVSEVPQVNQNNKRTYGRFYMDSLNNSLSSDKSAESQLKYQKAQEFLYFLSTKEAQQSFATKTGLPSAHKDVIGEQLNGDQQSRVFAQGALYADNYYKPDVDSCEQMWSDLFDRIQYNNVPVSESINLMATQYDKILQARPALRK